MIVVDFFHGVQYSIVVPGAKTQKRLWLFNLPSTSSRMPGRWMSNFPCTQLTRMARTWRLNPTRMCALSWTRPRKTRRERPKQVESNFYLVGFIFDSPMPFLVNWIWISLFSICKPARLTHLQSRMVASYPWPNCELRRTSKFAGECGVLDKLSLLFIIFSPLFKVRYRLYLHVTSTLPTTISLLAGFSPLTMAATRILFQFVLWRCWKAILKGRQLKYTSLFDCKLLWWEVALIGSPNLFFETSSSKHQPISTKTLYKDNSTCQIIICLIFLFRGQHWSLESSMHCEQCLLWGYAQAWMLGIRWFARGDLLYKVSWNILWALIAPNNVLEKHPLLDFASHFLLCYSTELWHGCLIVILPVDGQNPAPPRMIIIPLFNNRVLTIPGGARFFPINSIMTWQETLWTSFKGNIVNIIQSASPFKFCYPLLFFSRTWGQG